MRGQSHSWGQKKMGQLTQIVEAGLFVVAERMADGSIDDLDPDDFSPAAEVLVRSSWSVVRA